MFARESRALSVARLTFQFAVRSALALGAFAVVATALPAQVEYDGTVGVVPITGASLGSLSRAVSDGAGNLYIADPVNNDVVKVDTSGNATVLVGASGATYTFSLSAPGGIAIDTSGKLYIADTGHNEIVVLPRGGPVSVMSTGGTQTNSPSAVAVDPAGTVWVAMAGLGHVYGFNGGSLWVDIHPTGAAALSNPQGIAVDGNQNVYIADAGTGHVIDAKYFAGTNTIVSTGSIALGSPGGLAVDLSGNLYIADSTGNQVVAVTASGASVINTGTLSLLTPVALSFDGQNNLYISDGGHERVLETNETSADFGTAPVGGGSPVTLNLPFTFGSASEYGSVAVNDGQAASPDFTATNGTCTVGTTGGATCSVQVTFRPHFTGLRRGTVVIYDPAKTTMLATVPVQGVGAGPVLAFTPGTMSTLAGNGQEGYALGGGLSQPAASAEFTGPAHLAVDDSDHVYVADGDDAIRLEYGGTDTTVAGGGVGETGNGGPAINAGLTNPYGVALDGNGDLFIADVWGSWVREVSEPSGIISDYAGQEHIGFLLDQPSWAGDGGPALLADMQWPKGVATDGAGNVYIADTTNQVIRKVSAYGGITTIAGNYTLGAGYAGDGGAATLAKLNYPQGVAVDAAGNVYIADIYNNVIRKVTPDGTISTFAGNYTLGSGYTGDNGPATQAQLSFPSDVAIDGGGNLYIADYGNFAIRMVSAATGNITTVAGGTFCPSPWSNCFSGDGGPATAAEMSQPNGIAVDPSGNIFFSDVNNFRIRAVNVSGPPTLSFPNTNAGSTSAEETVSLSNLGTSPLTVTSMQLPSGFIWGPDTGCNTSATFQIQPGTSCELAIEFAPLGATNYSNSVTISENSLNNPTQAFIPLVGQGQQLTQTISFTQPASPVPYTAGLTIPLVATGGASGNPVVISIDPSSTGSGSIVGSTLDVTGGGTFVIDANQAGNTEYAAAPQVQVTFQVSQQQQTITFVSPGNLPLAQGSVALGATASSGLPVTYTILNGGGTINSGVLTFGGAGFVQIQANQAGNAAYAAAAPVNITLGVIPTMNPPSGTPLTGATQTFSWNTGGSSTQFVVKIGDQGATSTNVLNSGLITTPSVTVTNIPLNGKTLHVFLQIKTAWGASSFDYTYLEITAAPPALTAPAPVGGTLSGSSATFSWSAGAGNTSFRLAVGTQGVGSSDVYNGASTTNTSVLLTTIPTNGVNLNVRLYYVQQGNTQSIDYLYTEAGTPTPPALTTPAPSTKLSGSAVTFTWTPGAGPTSYRLQLGTTGAGSSNVLAGSWGAGTSVAVSNIPAHGLPLYARLSYKVLGNTQSIDYVYTEAGSPTPPALTTPAPSTKLSGASATFTWTAGVGPTSYMLQLGTTGVGSSNVLAGTWGTGTSVAVSNIPAHGLPLYARLSYKVPGNTQSIDYVYTEAGSPTPPALTTPAPSTKLSGTSVTFTWTPGVGPTSYMLQLGTTGAGSSDVVAGTWGSGTSVAVSNIPAHGLPLYARLSYKVPGNTQSIDYVYTEAGSPTPPALTTPAPSTKLSGASVTFTWTPGVGPTSYMLQLGTTGVGSSNILAGTWGTGTSVAVSNIPTYGVNLYARLFYKVLGNTQSIDYVYTEAGTPTPPALTTPTPSTKLSGATATFMWTPGAGPTSYMLQLGTTGVGSSNILAGAWGPGTSVAVSNIPTAGAKLYARLSYKLNGSAQHIDYVYTEK